MAAAQRLPYAIFLPIWITNECCLIGIQFCSSLKIFNNFKINARDSRYSEIISVVVCGMCVDGCKTLAAIVVMSPAIVPFLGLEGDTFSHHFEEGGVFAFIAHFFAIFKGNAILGFLAFAFIHAFVDTCQSVVTTYTMNIGAALGCKPKAETKRGVARCALMVYLCGGSNCELCCEVDDLDAKLHSIDDKPGCKNHVLGRLCDRCPGLDCCLGLIHGFELCWLEGAVQLGEFAGTNDSDAEKMHKIDVEIQEIDEDLFDLFDNKNQRRLEKLRAAKNIIETQAHLKGDPTTTGCAKCFCNPAVDEQISPFWGCGIIRIACCSELKKPEIEVSKDYFEKETAEMRRQELLAQVKKRQQLDNIVQNENNSCYEGLCCTDVCTSDFHDACTFP